MPVILQEHRVVSFLRDISNRIRWVTSGILCLTIFGVWLILFYFPLQSQINQYRQEINSLELETGKLKELKIQRCEIKKELTFMKEELGNKKDVMDRNSLNFILNKASDYGLACIALDPRDSKKHSFLESTKYEVSLKGSFQSLALYAKEFEHEDCCISIRQFEVVRDEDRDVTCTMHIKIPSLVGYV
jgi:Tfp pilus assembly protein PilO